MKKIKRIYFICRSNNSNFIIVLLLMLFYKLVFNKNILPHERTIIKGVRNIKSNTFLQIGLGNAQFVHPYDVTYLNIKGSLFFKGNHTIGRGCRFDIAEQGMIIIGSGGYINSNSSFIITHKLIIGNNCVISWNCLFLDNDFHHIHYVNKNEKTNEINIGNHVWIGCDVKIFKGTVIPNNCVIAAGSIVRGVFTEPDTLISGNPAKVIRRNISWN